MFRATRILAAAFLVMAAEVAAQGYPCKSVRFIVPAAAGGLTDVLARSLGQKLGDAFGVQFVVDNRAGAGGIIGTDMLAKSPPDGRTIKQSIPGDS